MEENLTLNGYLDLFLQENPSAVSAAEVFSRVFGASLGNLPASDISEAVISDCFEAAELISASREELFSSLVFLRLLLAFISRTAGIPMPNIMLPKSFLSSYGLSEQNATVLLTQFEKHPGRASFCLWLVLRAGVPVAAVLRLSPAQISLDGELLSVTYDTRMRNLSKPPKPENLKTVSVALHGDSLSFWREGFEPFRGSSFVLSSGDFRSGSRAKLQNALRSFAAESGFADLTLSMLEDFSWSEEEAASEDFTVGENGFDRIAASDAELTDFPTPDIAQLSRKISDLPIPVQEHSRRVRQISSFVLEFIRTEDWFLDLELDEFKILTAIYFHDVGKTTLNLESLYPSRINREENIKYRSHVNKGIDVLQATVDTQVALYPPQSFVGLLRDAIMEHHEQPDGKGFPEGKKELSFIGSLTSVADTIDHLLFSSEENEVSVPEILDKILNSAGTKFDARLLTVLQENKNKLIDFLIELRSYYSEKRKWDAYGMRFQFYPFQTSAGETVAYRAKLYLNDPFFGLIDSNVILPLMEEHPQYATFVRLEIKRLCRLICLANEQGLQIPPILIKIAVREPLRNKFFEELFKIFINNTIRYHQIIFGIDESDAIQSGANMPEIAEKFHLLGAQVALLHFGGETSLYPSLDHINPDFIVMRSEYIDAANIPMRLQFLQNVSQTCQKIGTKILMPRPVSDNTGKAFQTLSISAYENEFETAAKSEEFFLS